MTRADRILDVIGREIERRRAELDANDGLDTLTVVIRLNPKTGRPRELIWRPESRSDLVNGVACLTAAVR